jgi:PIN domain nuclease of toxin-antitoxin system
MVVLDTCALIEMCKREPAFSKETLEQIKAGAFILSVSFAEIACKIKARKLDIGISARNLYDKISEVETIKIFNIRTEEWLNAVELDWTKNNDPVDRLIVAFANQLQIPIITTDKLIRAIYSNTQW